MNPGDPIYVDPDGRIVDEYGEPVQEEDIDNRPGGADDDG